MLQFYLLDNQYVMKMILLAGYILSVVSCSQKKQAEVKQQTLPVMQVDSSSTVIYQKFPASIEGTTNVEIRPQISGTLDRVYVDEGALVAAGQILFKINDAPYRERLNNAKSVLHAAEGAFSHSQLEIEKLTPLVDNKVISDYQLKLAQTTHQISLANIEQAKADIASAQINLGYTQIKAPVSGYVGRLLKKQGSLVSPSDPAELTDLSDVHELHVYFALGEFDFINFKQQYPGTTLSDKIRKLPPVELILANDSTYSHKGKIDLFDGKFDKNTGAIMVRATFPNKDGLLRSGNTGKVKLGLKFKNAVKIPQSATIEIQNRIFVFLLGKGNTVSKQPITVFAKTETDYLVKEGLKPKDLIVTKGFDHLHEGEVILTEKSKENLINPVAKN